MVDVAKAAQYKKEIHEEWMRAAPAWKKWDAVLSESLREVSEKLLQAAELRSGMQVLDLASGTGEPALHAARLVAPGGRVTATDLAAEMLEAAREKAQQAGITNIECRECDAESLPFEDASFDAVTCRFGVMFFPQVEKAVASVHRVLKPGARAAFAAWGALQNNPYFATPIAVLSKYMTLPPPDPDRPNVFKFATQGSLQSALEASFPRAWEERLAVTMSMRLPPEQCFQAFVEIAAPFRRLVEGLPSETIQSISRDVQESARQFWDGTYLRIPAEVVLGVGVKA